MTMRSSVRDAMLAAVPSLRAFAISLCGNVDRADDLVQETLLRAMANIDSFQPGTNMSAWLFTILRNLFRSEYRKRRGVTMATRRNQKSASILAEWPNPQAKSHSLPNLPSSLDLSDMCWAPTRMDSRNTSLASRLRPTHRLDRQ